MAAGRGYDCTWRNDRQINIVWFLLLPVSLACGGFVAVYDNTTLTIESPDYPWPYRKAKSCSWRVCPPQGKKLEFNFTTFDLRTFDKLDIINGKTVFATHHFSLGTKVLLLC